MPVMHTRTSSRPYSSFRCGALSYHHKSSSLIFILSARPASWRWDRAPGFSALMWRRPFHRGGLSSWTSQREMLQKARRRLQRAGVPNVGYTQATAAKLPFQSHTFDIAFLVAVLGEVPDPRTCMNSIADVLRPDGLVVVAELPGDPDALAEEQLRDLTRGTGLEFVESVRISRSVITSFRRRPKAPDMRVA
jgi:SAM-dependent methyltransferase